MRSSLEKMLSELDQMERSAHRSTPLHCIDPRAKITVTVIYLITVLSTPLTRLSELILYALYPILLAAMGGFGFPAIFRRSLIVLPFVFFVGVFNIFYDTAPGFPIGDFVVTRGWVTFTALLLRGLLSVQAIILLIDSTGCYALCRALQRMGCPSICSSLLLFIYRYIYVLIRETVCISRAVNARSFGRSSYPLKVWGQIIGQLLIRTFDRATIIGQAMAARGFNGALPAAPSDLKWQTGDSLYLILWAGGLLAVRIFHPSETLFQHIFSL